MTLPLWPVVAIVLQAITTAVRWTWISHPAVNCIICSSNNTNCSRMLSLRRFHIRISPAPAWIWTSERCLSHNCIDSHRVQRLPLPVPQLRRLSIRAHSSVLVASVPFRLWDIVVLRRATANALSNRFRQRREHRHHRLAQCRHHRYRRHRQQALLRRRLQ